MPIPREMLRLYAKDMQGKVIRQNYQIEGFLGAGMFGMTFRAKELSTGDTVAIKILDGAIESRFRNEAKLNSMLRKSRYVPTLYTAFKEDESFYMVMEYVSYGNIRRLIREAEEEPIPVLRVIELLRNICIALDEAHALGIIHRDIKPENILLSNEETNEVKITDFGLARLMSSSGISSEVGTPGYMAPEIRTGKYDHRVDIYSTAVVWYQLLGGDFPIDVSGLRRGIPLGLKAIIRKAVEDEPSKRYSSVKDMLDDLANVERKIFGVDMERSVDASVMLKREAQEERIDDRAEIKEQKIEIYLKAGKKYLEQGNFDKAIAALRKIPSIDPNNEDVKHLLKKIEDEKSRISKEQDLIREKRKLDSDKWKRERKSLDSPPSGKKKNRIMIIIACLAMVTILGLIIHKFFISGSDQVIRDQSLDSIAIPHLAESEVFRKHGVTSECLSLSPNGRLLASAGQGNHPNIGQIKLWEFPSGRLVKKISGHKDPVYCLAFSPDGRYLASGSGPILASMDGDRTIKIWNSSTGQLVRSIEGHRDLVTSIAFSPEGRYLASASRDATIKLWEFPNVRLIRTLTGHEMGVFSIAFSPDGQLLASASADDTIRIWNVSNGSHVGTFIGHERSINCVIFSPNGHYLASASCDGTVRLWDVRARSLLKTLTISTYPYCVNSVSFSPGGRVLASSGDAPGWCIVWVWEVPSCRLVQKLETRSGEIESVTFTPDGNYLVWASKSPSRIGYSKIEWVKDQAKVQN